MVLTHSDHQAALSEVIFHDKNFIGFDQDYCVVTSDLSQSLKNFLLATFTVKQRFMKPLWIILILVIFNRREASSVPNFAIVQEERSWSGGVVDFRAS